MSRWWISSGLLVVVSLAVSGCGGGGTAPVSGKVSMSDGAALPGARVSFESMDGKITAVGTTDANGVYKLMTNAPGDGAPPGMYKVMVLPPPPPTLPYDESKGESPKYGPQIQIDPKLKSYDTSGLTYEVKSGENKFDIPISK